MGDDPDSPEQAVIEMVLQAQPEQSWATAAQQRPRLPIKGEEAPGQQAVPDLPAESAPAGWSESTCPAPAATGCTVAAGGLARGCAANVRHGVAVDLRAVTV